MNQFSKILKFELKYYFKNKIFVGITIFLVVLIAIVMCFPRFKSLFDKEDPAGIGTSEELEIMYLMTDNSMTTAEADQLEMYREAFSAAFSNYDVQIFDGETEELKNQIIAGNAASGLVMKSPTEYTYYVNSLSLYDMNTQIADEVLQHLYRVNVMMENGMTQEQVEEVMSVQIIGHAESLMGKDQAQNFFYTYIMIFALYMVILLYGQMVSTNVATEKSSRAMEVLITSAKPTSMMFGKVLASCLAGLLQLIAVFGSAVIFYNINIDYWGNNAIVESVFNIPPQLLIYMLIFFVLGFLIYAFLFGAIGSTATKLEDINTSTMPLIFLFIIAFMVVMYSMASGEIDNILMKVCSFIPFTSPMAMFTRIAMSTVPIYEIVISISILVGSVIGVGILSAKIYRVGVLLYGTTPKFSAIVKALWKA
ncbi:MAG: ABC transporter permease [Lachnospiraceae bacterium]|nr:ABC transporter permease [Lachnospiraceae bacterium]